MSTLTLRSTTPLRPIFGMKPLAMLSLARQRAALAAMDDAQLRDLGLTRDEALAEARRPIWDLPKHAA